MALLDFLHIHTKSSEMIVDDEVLRVLRELEGGRVLEPNMSLKAIVTQNALLKKRRVVSGGMHFSHFAEYVFSLIDEVYGLLKEDRFLSPELYDALYGMRMAFARVAFEDDRFLLDHTHPARVFLDKLLNACIGSESLSHDDIALQLVLLIKQLNSLVDFDFTIDERLQNILNQEAERAESIAAKKIEVIKRKLQINNAEISAEKILAELLELYKIPESIKPILKIWKNFIIDEMLDDSVERQEWLAEVDRFADVFVLINNVNKQKLVAIDWGRVDQQKRYLAEIFERLNVTKSRSETLLKALHDYYNDVEMGKTVTLQRVSIKEHLNCAADFDLGYIMPNEMDLLSELEVGSWLDMKNEEGHSVIAQLIAKIPESSSLILMSRKGPKVFECTFSEIAIGMDAGQVKIRSCKQPITQALDIAVYRAGGHCRRMDARSMAS